MKLFRTVMIALVALITSSIVAAQELELEIFVAEPSEINVTSPMLMGPTEMLVMSAQGTKSSATRLADEIEKTGLQLKYIFLSHAHLDHSQGATILLERFPEAKFIAVPEVAKLQRHRMEADDKRAVARYGDNAAIPSTPAEDFDGDKLFIDGIEVQIWHNIIGDAGIGHADEEHTALYIPSIKALLPSDVVYFNAHVMTGGSTPESRKRWIEQLEGWRQLNLDTVVPGHMLKTDKGNLTANGALDHTINYLKDYDRVIAEKDSANEVINVMRRLYPGMQHESALLLGTYVNFKEMHRLLFNSKIEKVAEFTPDFILTRINNWMFNKAKKEANLDE